MKGTRSAPRIRVMRASWPMNRRQAATVITLAITIVHTIASVTAR